MELSTKTDSGTYFLYHESFWTGKRSLTVDGVPATKIARKTFRIEKKVKIEVAPSADVNQTPADPFNDSEASAEEKPVTEASIEKPVATTVSSETVDYTIKGSFLTGVSLVSSKNETIVLAKNKWYDWIMIFLPMVGIVFGVAFCGAIGGGLSALFTMLGAVINAVISRSKIPVGGKIPLQLVVAVVANALWFACWYVIAVVILSLASNII